MADVNEMECVLGHEIDATGRLVDLEVWDEDIAEAIAAREGLTLQAAHWEVIHLMREYYQSFNISPIKKLLKKEIADRFGVEKADDGYLDALFPGGVLDQGTRLAGLPPAYLDEELQSRPAVRAVVVEEEKEDDENRFVFEGHVIHLAPSGNILEHHMWNEAMAEILAAREGITLTDDHWTILDFLRTFYAEYGIAPMVRLLKKHMKQSGLSTEREHLYRLFPRGPARQGSRIAGLPDPQGCIDS